MTSDIAYQRLLAVESALRALVDAGRDIASADDPEGRATEYLVARGAAEQVLDGVASYEEAVTIASTFVAERATRPPRLESTATIDTVDVTALGDPEPVSVPAEESGDLVEGTIVLPAEPAPEAEPAEPEATARPRRRSRGAPTVADLEGGNAD